MTDSEPLRPTNQRILKADHILDDGSPTKEKPYVRAQRLGTAWDRYSRSKDGEGRVLADSEMTLTRAQIAIGEEYIQAYYRGMWGGPVGSRMEPGVSGSFAGPPAHQLDQQKRVWRLESKLKPEWLRTLVQIVLIDGLSAEEWARRTGRHPKSGIEIFRLCLDMMGAE